MYNVLFTFCPAVAYGILDKDVSDELLDEFPQLYKSGIRGDHVSVPYLC